MSERDPHRLALEGLAADAAEAARLESLLATNPTDLDARTKLLGYYFQRSFTEADSRRRKIAHCLWLIRHRPESQIAGTPFCRVERFIDAAGYRKARALWDKQVRQRHGDTAVLSNAAHFYTGKDQRTAITILKRLQRMEPRNPEWRDRLGHLYHLQAGVGPGLKRNKAAAMRALKEWEAALALLRTDLDRFYLLTHMAPIAVDAGRLPKAVRYARILLRYAGRFRADWNNGNALHYAHSTLGRAALRRKQVAAAKKHLIASARTKGSPQLGSFGPSHDLAAELLARGEAPTVVRYLELCRKFWNMGEKHIDAWTRSIRESGTTDFFPVFDAIPGNKKASGKSTRKK
jgi:tetratricopeptide (TPR) repeat protein